MTSIEDLFVFEQLPVLQTSFDLGEDRVEILVDCRVLVAQLFGLVKKTLCEEVLLLLSVILLRILIV